MAGIQNVHLFENKEALQDLRLLQLFLTEVSNWERWRIPTRTGDIYPSYLPPPNAQENHSILHRDSVEAISCTSFERGETEWKIAVSRFLENASRLCLIRIYGMQNAN